MKKLMIPALVSIAGAVVLLARADHPGPRWTPGKAYRYRFEVDVDRTTQAPTPLVQNPDGGSEIDFRMKSEGTVLLSVVDTDETGVFAIVRVEPGAMLSVDMLGQSIASGTTKEGRDLGVHIAIDGTVDRTFFPDDFPLPQRILLQNVFAESRLSRSQDGVARWRTEEQDLQGRYTVEYQEANDRIEKRKISYSHLPEVVDEVLERARQQLEHSARIELDGDDHLAHLAVQERFELLDGDVWMVRGSKRIELRLQAVEVSVAENQVRPELFAEALSAPPEARISSPDLEKQMLVQQAAGMTLEKIQRTIAFVHVIGPTPDHRERFWRSVGFLTLHPEDCRALEASFEKAHPIGRALTLDLLVGAGHPVAQEVLRKLLDSPEAAADDHAYEYLDRLMFLRSPSPETVAYARARREASSGKNERSLTFALGAMVGHLVRSGELERARAVNAELVAELERAAGDQRKRDLLGALGNAGVVENIPVIARFARDPSGVVRYAAAYALRQLPNDESAQVLLEIARGNGINPQHAALTTLRINTTLEPKRLDEVVRLVYDGVIRTQNYDDVVTILANNRDRRLSEIARFMLTRVSGADALQVARLEKLARES